MFYWRLLIMFLVISSWVKISQSIRCYTNLEESRSLECGMATGCVKIVKKSSEFDAQGKFIPKEKRSESVDLFKGCFLISTPDVCHKAKDGLTYCWCSSNDLCNISPPLRPSLLSILLLLLGSLLQTLHW